MRIRHNIPGMNTFRAKSKATKDSAKTLEKLSSGYRINRSADDAAGLSVSEKMRIAITGLDRAVENSSDGINLIQIAEGAMGEMHDMIDRMFSLAEQSMNGTYTDETDRVQLDKEYQKLLQEIDRIADSTSYGDIKLLDGSNMRQGKDPAGESAQRIATLLEINASRPMIAVNEQLSGAPAATGKAQVAGMNQNGVVIAYASGESESEVREIREKASEDNAKMEAEQSQAVRSGGSARAAAAPKVAGPVDHEINISGTATVNEDGWIDISKVSQGSTIQIADGRNVRLTGSSKDVKIVCGDNVTLHLDGVEMENSLEDNVIDIQGKGCILNLIRDKENKLRSTAEIVLSPDTSKIDEDGRLFDVLQSSGKAVIHVQTDADLTISGEAGATLSAEHTQNSDYKLADCTQEYYKNEYIKKNPHLSGLDVDMNEVLRSAIKDRIDYYTAQYIGKHTGEENFDPAKVTEDDVLQGLGWNDLDKKWCCVGKRQGGKVYAWNMAEQKFEPAVSDFDWSRDAYSRGVQSAVIGGNAGEVCGSITITGGSVSAEAGHASSGAAIGSGDRAAGGKIVIEGGTVVAKAKSTGAGIGGGSSGAGGEITISNGATVTATGGEYSAGIGSGWNGTSGGRITISDEAVVTASGGRKGAGIGGGDKASGGEIVIKDQANVTATGDSGAGIGGGDNAFCGNIVIEGGTVNAATNGRGAGIGNGGGLDSTDERAAVGSITITGPDTTVNASNGGGLVGAAIGDGAADEGNGSRVYTPKINVSNGASVTVTSDNRSSGAAIGGGGGCFLSDLGDPSEGGTLNINGGTVTVNSGWIGGGADYHLPDVIHYANDGPAPNVTNGGILNYTDPRPAGRIPHDELTPPPDKPDPPPDGPDLPPDGPDPSPADRISYQNNEEGGGLILQIGETNAEYNRLHVYIDDMHTSAMGLDRTNILTQDNAAKAMTACRIAKNYVSNARGDMGAYINRLEHNINALKSSHENAVDSESSIRDADMASETLNFTKYNILNQSAQAMLAQANQLPNGVLQLLQQ